MVDVNLVVLLYSGGGRWVDGWVVMVVVVSFALTGIPNVASEPVLNKFPECIVIHL